MAHQMLKSQWTGALLVLSGMLLLGALSGCSDAAKTKPDIGFTSLAAEVLPSDELPDWRLTSAQCLTADEVVTAGRGLRQGCLANFEFDGEGEGRRVMRASILLFRSAENAQSLLDSIDTPFVERTFPQVVYTADEVVAGIGILLKTVPEGKGWVIRVGSAPNVGSTGYFLTARANDAILQITVETELGVLPGILPFEELLREMMQRVESLAP